MFDCLSLELSACTKLKVIYIYVIVKRINSFKSEKIIPLKDGNVIVEFLNLNHVEFKSNASLFSGL